MAKINVLGVIPARYGSSRLPGKPLSDIMGKPMIWWTYERARVAKGISDLIIATDDARIVDVCEKYNMKVMLTKNHKTHIDRIQEVSDCIDSDLYLVICGDEPLIEPENIEMLIPQETPHEKYYVGSSMRKISSPSELMDPGNIKIEINSKNECIMMSRSPIPFPYKTVLFDYLKLVGVECYNKGALDLFVSKDAGIIEKIEDITLTRFIENGVLPKMTMLPTSSLSVDTEKDLEKVRLIMKGMDRCK